MRRLTPLLILLCLAACRVGGGSSSPAATAGALEISLGAFAAAFQAVSASLTAAFTEGTVPGDITDYRHTLLCDTSGPENEGTSNMETRIQDRTFEGTFLVSTNLKNCGDVDGDIDAVGRFERGTADTSFEWDYTGLLKSGGCDIDLSGLTVSSVQSETSLSLVSGILSATCETAEVSCAWSQTPVLDEASLLAGCSCSGSGC